VPFALDGGAKRVARAAFLVDGRVRDVDRSAPFRYGERGVLDTARLTNGPHRLAVRVTGRSGRTRRLARTINVRNTRALKANRSAPSLTWKSPTSGQLVSGVMYSNCEVTASDRDGIARVDFSVDGNYRNTEYTYPYNCSFDTTKVSNGTHYLKGVAYDTLGNSRAKTIQVTVQNSVAAPTPTPTPSPAATPTPPPTGDTTAPAVQITAPGAGATVTGTASVAANASDNSGVAGVQFKLDGANLGTEDTTSPYSTSWDSAKTTSGAHTLTAVARDAAGNTATTSEPVTVGTATPQAASLLLSETVATGTSTGDGANPWGAHQSRMVRTAKGLFTAWTTPGADGEHRNWNLAWRDNGTWKRIASGPSGREPMHLLAASDGRLWIIAWPPSSGGTAGVPTAWNGMPDTATGTISMSSQTIPGSFYYDGHSYSGAAIGPDDAIYLLESMGDGSFANEFRWARRDPVTGQWAYHTTPTDARYTYAYLLPDASGGLRIVATIDETWGSLGYAVPPSGSSYVFNKVMYWHTTNASAASPTFVSRVIASESPTSAYPEPFAYAAQSGGLLDSAGRSHILYYQRGASTGGQTVTKQVVVGADDSVGAAATVPNLNSGYMRMVANGSGRLFVVGVTGTSTVNIWPVPDPAQGTVGTPTSLNLGATILYGGLMGADPRGGTPSSDQWDLGFPSGSSGEVWRYARIQLPTP
jgi:hypothetical protein